ncbi:MAG: 2-C-methyl-D-erythritol 4-phosphate cytidylyltransferase [Desulfococcaceae bacterium]
MAGGGGLRMGGPVRKQYRTLAGRPILAHTLATAAACPEIEEIVLVVPAEDHEMCQATVLAPLGISTPVKIATGGAERQMSVANGLENISEGIDLVAVHDGVRPFVRPAEFSAVLAAAEEHGAAILAVPAADTLKRADGQGNVRETLDRADIWMALTPQAFRLDLLKEAHAAAQRDQVLGTDDAALVERLGRPVHLVRGGRTNLKITTPEDLILARALLTAAGEPPPPSTGP